MTTRPGVNVLSRSAPPPRGAPLNTGQAFVIGMSERGPTNKAVLIHNPTEFDLIFGARQSYSVLHDWMETYFREGGTLLYVARVVGPGAVTAKVTLADRAGAPLPTLDVSAIGPGSYANGATGGIGISVTAGIGANDFVINVFFNAVLVEQSYNCTSIGDAVAWGTSSAWVRVTDRASATAAPLNNPAVAAVANMTLGNDDHANAVDAQRSAALALFSADLGPGQVAAPGSTSDTMHTILINHALANNRIAVCDALDTATVATLVLAATAQRAAAPSGAIDPSYGALFAPWDTIPGLTAGTTRSVPPSARVCGSMAAQDAQGGPNTPAAGVAGGANFTVGLSQPAFLDADRQTLNAAGVNISRVIYGGVRTYGYRTLANPADPVASAWLALSNQRLRMAIIAQALAIGEAFMFDQLDGQLHTITAFGGALKGMLNRYFVAGELFGTAASDAFSVDVGPSVNTLITMGNNELHAVIGLRMSPYAEMVYIEIVKVAITQSL